MENSAENINQEPETVNCACCQAVIPEDTYPKHGIAIQKSADVETDYYMFCNQKCMARWITDQQLLSTEELQAEHVQQDAE